MSRHSLPPPGFHCPHRDRCPHAEELSVRFLFHEYHRAHERERLAEQSRMDMVVEITRLEAANREQAVEIDRLRAEVKTLRTAPFAKGKKKTAKQGRNAQRTAGDVRKKPRGAPEGHPPWTREDPESVDQVVEVMRRKPVPTARVEPTSRDRIASTLSKRISCYAPGPWSPNTGTGPHGAPAANKTCVERTGAFS